MKYRLIHADVLDGIGQIPDESVQCVVTSPPYWGLRDYGIEPSVWPLLDHSVVPWRPQEQTCLDGHEWVVTEHLHQEMRRGINLAASVVSTRGGGKKIANVPDVDVERAFCSACGAWRGCLGLEPTYALYVEHIVAVFAEVWRVLRKDGTLWLNLGDSYQSGSRGGYNRERAGVSKNAGQNASDFAHAPNRMPQPGLKDKDLVGIPWRVAFALQEWGWWLRSDIVWHKPNPMPESVTDRPTKAHEIIFLLAKSERYFYDADAIREPCSDTPGAVAWAKIRDPRKNFIKAGAASLAVGGGGHTGGEARDINLGRNKRSVWTIATQPFPEAHFATFPEEIPRLCISAGSHVGDIVLDPFSGAGTTGLVALELGREYVGIERSAEYVAMSERRLRQVDAWQPSLLGATP